MLVSETARVVPGLVLVETGLGDIERPEQSLGRTFLDRTAAILEPGETPVHQIARLGYSPKDVRPIVLTHLDLDHTGRAPRLSRRQGPRPRRRVPAAMATTSTHPKHAIRYRPAHWAHHPHWVTYTTASRGAWFGFDAIELDGLPADFLLVPPAGHTAGHCAVAVHTGDRWMLHAGDAYYHDGQVNPTGAGRSPYWRRSRSSPRSTAPCAWPTSRDCSSSGATTQAPWRSFPPMPWAVRQYQSSSGSRAEY